MKMRFIMKLTSKGLVAERAKPDQQLMAQIIFFLEIGFLGGTVLVVSPL